MRIFAYCCERFKSATRRAAGVEPLTCPPVSMEFFDPVLLEGCDLLYFDLHGEPGESFWRGDGGIVALTEAQIRAADLGGVVAFAVNCYLADEDSPMMDALLDAGASYVIGGNGQNYAGTRSPKWAGLLGLWTRRLMTVGFSPLQALALSKQRVRVKAIKDRVFSKGDRNAVKDTLGFKAYYRRFRIRRKDDGKVEIVV